MNSVTYSVAFTDAAFRDHDLSLPAGLCLGELWVQDHPKTVSILNHGMSRLNVSHLLTLRIPDSLIYTQNQRGSFSGATDRIKLDETWLPDKRVHIVPDTSGPVNIDTVPLFAIAVFVTQLVQDVRRIQARIITYLAWNHLQGLGKCDQDKLLLSGDRQSMFPNVRR